MYGKIIKKLRKEKKLTQEDLAKLINFKSGSAIGMIEREERELSLNTLNKLSEIFNVSTDYILGHTVERYPGEIKDLGNELMEKLKEKLPAMDEKTKNRIKKLLDDV